MGSISAISRTTDYLDIFTVGLDGHIYTAYWNPHSGGWQGFNRVGDLKVPRKATVTAIPHAYGAMYIFAVDENGRVCGNQWNQHDPNSFDNGSWDGWQQIEGMTAPPGAYVGAGSSSPFSIDLFVCCADEKVWHIYYHPRRGGHNWRGPWAQLLPAGISVVPSSPVNAVSRSDGWLDIFLTDKDGRVMSASYYYQGKKWNGWWNLLGGRARPGAAVTACVRAPDQLDIFVVNVNGNVCTAAWNPGQTDGWHGWWEVGSETKFPSGGWITAVSRSRDMLDIFGVDESGRTVTAWWSPGANAWSSFRQINNGGAHAGLPLTSVSRRQDYLDIFVVGTGGDKVHSAGWAPENTDWWHGWWGIGGDFSAAVTWGKYRLYLHTLAIHEIRSRYNDTLHISTAAAVGGRTPIKTYRYIGDQKPGTLELGDGEVMDVEDDDVVVFSYAIVNNGHESRPVIERRLKQALEVVVSKGSNAAVGIAKEAIASAIGAAVGGAIAGGVIVPIIGSALGALAGWLSSEGVGILFKDCDGPVASGVHAFKGSELRAKLANSKTGTEVLGKDRAPTSDVAGDFGCGAPSDYEVFYAVQRA